MKTLAKLNDLLQRLLTQLIVLTLEIYCVYNLCGRFVRAVLNMFRSNSPFGNDTSSFTGSIQSKYGFHSLTSIVLSTTLFTGR